MTTTGSIVPSDVLGRLNGAAAQQAAAPTRNDALDKKEFLTLFIRQLQAQDPLNPMDAQQLTAQLAQLTTVEQITNMNEKFDKVVAAAEQGLGPALLNLIGKQVAVAGGQSRVHDEEAAPVKYSFAEDASQVSVTVVDADGTVVREEVLTNPAARLAGQHEYQWDGKDAEGEPVDDGVYRVTVTALGADGETALPVTLRSLGTVDEVDLAANPPVFVVGGQRFTIDQLGEVRAAPTT